MPIYEHRCRGCGHEFTLVLSISEHDKEEAVSEMQERERRADRERGVRQDLTQVVGGKEG
jgi:predicted nucleic acid-binding Zn ribbon protein